MVHNMLNEFNGVLYRAPLHAHKSTRTFKKGDKIDFVAIVRLLGIEYGSSPRHSEVYWLCKCLCGTKIALKTSRLRGPYRKSCGICARRGNNSLHVTHGLRRHPIYQTWCHIMGRCYDEKNKAFKSYGGRGIQVDKEWRLNRTKFFDWSLANGWSKGLQLDRIDNDGPYSPNNCRFVTCQINNNNRRDNIRGVIFGQSMTLAEAVRQYGAVKYSTAQFRFSRGHSFDDCILLSTEEFRHLIKSKKNRSAS